MTDITIGVCGFGRCGSTMVMRMLAAGGVLPVAGTTSGAFEVESLAATFGDPDVVLAGRSVKILDYPNRLPDANWRFIWLDRDPAQQALSSLKLLAGAGALGDLIPQANLRNGFREIAWNNRNARPSALAALKGYGPVEVLQFERILARPARALRQIRHLLPEGFDWDAAVAVVDTGRDPRCAPNLDRELADLDASEPVAS